MKKILYTLLILSSIFVLGGCSKDDDCDCNKNSGNENTGNGGSGTNGNQTNSDFTVLNPDSIGNAKAPGWSVISDVDPTSLEVITIDVDHLPATVNENDVLAAFVGDECRGKTKPFVDVDDKTRCVIVINNCGDEDCMYSDNMELRYYSENRHRVFISEEIQFTPSLILGNSTISYSINWR